MAVEVTGGDSLLWDAGIELDSFSKDKAEIIKGFQDISTAAEKSSEKQDTAFQKVKKGLQELGVETTKLEKVYNDFNRTKEAVADLQTELAKLKAPDYLTGKTPEQIKNVNIYIKQQEALLQDLQKTMHDYADELVRITEMELKPPTISPDVPIDVAPPAVVDQAAKKISLEVIKELKEQFEDLTPEAQKFITTAIEMQVKLQELTQTQDKLNAAFSRGQISQEEYNEATKFVLAGIQNITDETKRLTDEQAKHEAAILQSTGSIDAYKAKLAELEGQFDKLTEAERDTPVGRGLAADIASLDKQIKLLDPTKVTVAKNELRDARKELSELQGKMLAEPNSPMFKEWQIQAGKLKEEIKAVTTAVGQATNSTAGLEAFASALKGLLGAYTAGVGIIGLFTEDTEEFDKVTKNAASAIAVLNGVQEVSNILSKNSALNIYLLNLLKKKDVVATAAQTAATGTNTVATTTQTLATEGQIVATTAATSATRRLTAAMLANPAAVIVGAIAAIATAYLILRDNQIKAKSSSDLLRESEEKITDTYAEKLAKVLPLVEAVKQGNLTEERSIMLHKELQAVDADLVKGLDAKALAYDRLSLNLNVYIDSLRKQYRLEVNKDATIESIKQEESIRSKIKLTEKYIADQKIQADQARSQGRDASAFAFGVQNALVTLRDLNGELGKQETSTKSLVEDTVKLSAVQTEAAKRSVDAIDADIAAIRKRINANAEDRAAYKKGQEEIAALEKEREKITGQSKQQIRAAQSLENKAQREYNKLLEEQKSLLETIDGLKRDSYQSGLVKKQSELDKINEKYDKALEKIKDFNARAPKNLQVGTKDLETARETELTNQRYKNDAALYKESLDQKEGYFKQYEDFKEEYGKKKADNVFKDQLQGNTSYLEFLKKQKSDIEKAAGGGALDVGQVLKIQELNNKIRSEEARANEAAFKKQIDDYANLLNAAVSYRERLVAINRKYDELQATLEKNYAENDPIRKEKQIILDQQRADELKAAENAILRESEMYRQLNADLIGYTRDQLQERLRLLKKYLKEGKVVEKDGTVTILTPEMIAALKAGIKDGKEAVKGLNEYLGFSKQELDEMAGKAHELGGTFGGWANSVRELSPALANVLDTMSSIANIAGDIVSAFASFASGDIVGGIGSALKVVTGIFNIGKRRREERRKAKEERDKFYREEFIGEIAINDKFRERLLLQAKINKLRIEGLVSEKKALEQNKASLLNDYNKVLAEIQKQTFQAGYKKLFTGLPGTANVKDIQSLNGKTFEELQDLFLTGKLDAKAKELFEELNRIKQAGVDVDAMLEQNKLAMQEVLTGTTSDNILDSIVQGFADGKRATADFADDFENLMKGAILNSLKYQALEKPLKKFYEDFAAAAESDGILTQAEIDQLQQYYNATITAAAQQFEQLQNITDINFSPNGGNSNSLSGAIKGITQQQADLLAGQFAGLRLTAVDQLTEIRNVRNVLMNISNYTSLLIQVESYLNYININGVKIRP